MRGTYGVDRSHVLRRLPVPVPLRGVVKLANRRSLAILRRLLRQRQHRTGYYPPNGLLLELPPL